jgi:hypothetical protein
MDQRPAAVGGRRRSGTTGEPVGRREIRHHVRRCRRDRRPLHATGDRPLAGRRAPRPGPPRLALGSAQRTRSARWLTAAQALIEILELPATTRACSTRRARYQRIQPRADSPPVYRHGTASRCVARGFPFSSSSWRGHRRAVPVFEGTSSEPISRNALTFVTPAHTSPVIQGLRQRSSQLARSVTAHDIRRRPRRGKGAVCAI